MTTPRRMLLDTSVVIDLERLDLGDYADVRAAVSAVTIAELAYGVDVSDPVERHARSERYQATINHFEVIPFDLAAAKLYGVLASLVRGFRSLPTPTTDGSSDRCHRRRSRTSAADAQRCGFRWPAAGRRRRRDVGARRTPLGSAQWPW